MYGNHHQFTKKTVLIFCSEGHFIATISINKMFVDFAFDKATFDDVVNSVADDVLALLAAEDN